MGMRLGAVFDRINPFTGMAGMVVLAILLVATIFLTVFDLPWIAFLSGIFFAAAIGLVGRLAYAETALSEVRESVRYIDDELPIMIAYVSADGRVQFHNQAFRLWLRARRETINGRPLRDVVGLTIFGQLKSGLDAAMQGRLSQETRIHEGLGSADSRIYTQYLPRFGEGGATIGAYLIQTDVSSLADRIERPGAALPGAVPADQPTTAPVPLPPSSLAPSPAPNIAEPERRIFVNTMTEELTGWRNAGDRLRAAIEGDEFCLSCQAIVPVSPGASGAPLFEMLLRLRAEEESLMPPGAFLPIAEESGLLPDLDRWVVRHVLKWAREKPGRLETTYCINVSIPTISDHAFPALVAGELRRHGIPGSLLCFEILEADVLARSRDAARFVSALTESGCRTTLCGFGRNAESYGLLKHLGVDFLKIDGDIILGLARNPVDLIKLKAIARVARATNRRTIAEFVEDEATLARLREHGVDFAQGFAIARPVPLSELA